MPKSKMRVKQPFDLESLPLEILQNVMLRLPARSLIRLGVCSKAWRNRLIYFNESSPSLFKQHYQTHRHTPAFLVALKDDENRKMHLAFVDQNGNFHEYISWMFGEYYVMRVLAVSDEGFFWAACYRPGMVTSFVCNPSFGWSKEVPAWDVKELFVADGWAMRVDHATYVCTLVILQNGFRNDGEREFRVYVCEIGGQEKWRTIVPLNDTSIFYGFLRPKVVFRRDRLFWISNEGLAVLDLKRETLKRFDLPCSLSLFPCDGFLFNADNSLIFVRQNGAKIESWKLEEFECLSADWKAFRVPFLDVLRKFIVKTQKRSRKCGNEVKFMFEMNSKGIGMICCYCEKRHCQCRWLYMYNPHAGHAQLTFVGAESLLLSLMKYRDIKYVFRIWSY